MSINEKVTPTWSKNVINEEEGGFIDRLLAYLIDGICVGVPTVVLEILAKFLALQFFGDDSFKAFIETWTDIILMACYYGYFYSVKGTSPGKKIMGLRITNTDGQNLSILNSIARESIGKAISLVSIVGFFMPLLRKDKKALHDLIFKSRVSKEIF